MTKLWKITATSNKGEISFHVYGKDFAEAMLNGLSFDAYNTEVYTVEAIEKIDLNDPKNKVVSF